MFDQLPFSVEVGRFCHAFNSGLVVWCSGNILCPINEVNLRRARLVLACVQVNHLGKSPATQVDWAFYGLSSVEWYNEYRLMSWVVVKGNGECSTIAASLGGSVATD